MTDNAPVDLKRLAEEAAREVYSPAALKCWPWSHQWTMWKQDFKYSMYWTRRCLRCGKPHTKPFY